VQRWLRGARRALPRSPRFATRRRSSLGRNKQTDVPILLSERARLEHAHFIGTTGGGKSKAMEACIRQDIRQGRGVCVIDPHGNHPESLYASLIGWLHDEGYTKGGRRERTIHLIDPNAPTHTVGFNPLALPTARTDVAVVAKAALQAFERVWGDEDTQEKPTLRRVLLTTFITLAELKLTLAEADLLYDPDDEHGIRAWALAAVKHPFARDQLKRLHRLASDRALRQSFELEVLGPINRLAEFLSSEPMRAIVGQKERAIDLCAALDEGHIVLANIAGGDLVDEQSADMLGRLLTRYILFHTKRRRNLDRSYFVYLDECYRYLSGDVPTLLAEARKYKVGLVLAHQFLGQFGVADEMLLAAVRNCTNLKAVFRLRDNKDAQDLAEMAVPLDLEMPVKPLVQPKVIGHRTRRFDSASKSDQSAVTDSVTVSEAESVAVTEAFVDSLSETFAEGESSMASEGLSLGEGASLSSITGAASGMSTGQTLTPPGQGAGLFDTPVVMGFSEGTSALTHSAEGSASSSMRSRNTASASGKNTMRASAVGSARSEAISHARAAGRATGKAQTRGSSATRGSQEGLEPIMADLPSAVHGKENMLYMAAQTLRNLTTGTAFINFVDATGMKAALLAVPEVRSYAPEPAAFEQLRLRILDASPSAQPSAEAHSLVARRKALLMDIAKRASEPPEPQTPSEYRVTKERAPPEPKSPTIYRTKKERPSKEKKDQP
jgi:PAS domain-containing protein